jgi:hypothetical protein
MQFMSILSEFLLRLFVCRLGGIRSVNIYGLSNHTMKFLRMDDWWGNLLVMRFGVDFLG